jgi:hypothetical protein
MFPGLFESVSRGDHCIAFLKTITPGTYEFATREYGKILVSAGRHELSPSDTPERAVEKLLIASLDNANPEVVIVSVQQLARIGGEASRDPLWRLAQRRDASDAAIRGEALASLLSLEYVPAGEEAVKYLKEPSWSSHVDSAKSRARVAFRAVRSPEFIPQLRLLSAPDDPVLRANAVSVLRGMRDPSSIPWLVQALDDGSPEVRYQAMMGLAETLGRGPGWTIGTDGFGEHGDELIAKWKEWWREDGISKYGPGQPALRIEGPPEPTR